MNYENSILNLLSYAAEPRRKGRFLSVASFADGCNLPKSTVRTAFSRESVDQIAEFYGYDIRIRKKNKWISNAATYAMCWEMAAVRKTCFL